MLEAERPQAEETIQEKYDRSLKKTRTGFGARLNAFFANFRSVDEEFFEELEELLIMSDVGVQVASNLTEELRYEARLENAKKPDALKRVIIEKLVDLYEKDGQFNEAIRFQDGLTVMLFVGVNGVGKTTSIGKLAHRYKQKGKKVMLVAADTFRAGAVAQLAEWGRRVDVPVVTGPEKSDPASVVFDGMERAVAEQVDVLMIDTAGRLQNKDNLMAELEKSVALSSAWILQPLMKPSWPWMRLQDKMPWSKPRNSLRSRLLLVSSSLRLMEQLEEEWFLRFEKNWISQ